MSHRLSTTNATALSAKQRDATLIETDGDEYTVGRQFGPEIDTQYREYRSDPSVSGPASKDSNAAVPGSRTSVAAFAASTARSVARVAVLERLSDVVVLLAVVVGAERLVQVSLDVGHVDVAPSPGVS